MATPTITTLTRITNADSTTGWLDITSGPGLSLNNDLFTQGTGAIGRRMNSTALKGFWFDIGAGNEVNHQTTGNEHVWFWVFVPFGANMATRASGGLRIRVGSTTANYNEWYVGGSDVPAHINGWTRVVVDVDNTPASTTGGSGLNSASGRYYGITCTWSTTPGGNIAHMLCDAIDYGDGITVTGGTSGDVVTWADIEGVSESNANRQGAVQLLTNGTYELNGQIEIGDNAGSNTYVKDESQILAFAPQVYDDGSGNINTTVLFGEFNQILLSESTGSTHFEDGIKVGTGDTAGGRSGSVFSADERNGAEFDSSDVNVEDVLLYGTVFRRFLQGLVFSDDATNGPTHEVIGCTFENCGQMEPNRVEVRDCVFAGYDRGHRAAMRWNANIDIKNCAFLGASDDVVEKDFGHVWQFDGGTTYVDETTDANNATDADWQLYAAGEAANDALIVGHLQSFDRIEFDNANGTAGVGASLGVDAQYLNFQGIWVTITPTNNGTGSPYFTVAVADNQDFSFDPPDNWDKMLVNGVELYWMRFRISTGSYSTNPVYDQGRIEARPAAIQHPASGTFTYDNLTFSGNDRDIYNSSGSSITVQTSNGADPTTSKGDAVTIEAVVSITVTAIDAVTLGNIENARVLLEADTGGPLPVAETVTITRSGSTATVAHTAHGIGTGQKVTIRGANEQEYNGVFVITVTGVNAYTYTVSGSPATPATGTIDATGVIVEGLTNVSGVVTNASFPFTTNQPVTGTARKGGTTPLYKASPLTGDVTADGYDQNTFLVPDE